LYYFKYIIFIVFISFNLSALSQEIRPDTLNLPQLPDTTQYNGIIPLDTINGDEIAPIIQDSIMLQQSAASGDIETTINYSAEDSFYFDYQNRIIKLYGNARVTYGEISLEAAEIEMDWNTNTVYANGVVDSTGKLMGKPVFKEGEETYETVSMSYNFNSKRAVIKGVVTQQGEAFMHAGRIKKDADDVVYGERMIYTTCNLPEPHFHIEAGKFKKLPKGNTLVGPFHLRVNDIPTPVGFLFGMFPNKRERSSGIVIPSYGEERRRGFYLKDGGYYFNISDYLDMKVLGEIYSKGSYGLQLQSNYLKRYAYDGNLRVEMNNQRFVTEQGDTTASTDTWFTWSHRPVSLRNSRISADVSVGSSSYNNNNLSYDPNRNMRQEFNSSITYNRTFRGTPFSFGTAIRFNQNVATGQSTLIFPDMSLNMNRIYPLKNLPGKSNAWYKKIYLGQNFNYRRTITNREVLQSESGQDSITVYRSFWGNFDDHWRRAQTDQSQAEPLSFDIPLSTSFNVFKFFNFSPTIRYTEQWFFNSLTYSYDEEQNRFNTDDPKGGFYRAFRTSFGGKLATNVYGFYNPKLPGIQRIRHVITPSVDFTYTPDLSARIFGYYRDFTFAGADGDTTAYLRRLTGAPGIGPSGILTFDVSNNVEMKVLTKKDTTGQSRKVALIENLSFSTQYDYLRDSFQLQNIRFSGRTSIWQRKVSLSLNGTIDPYSYVDGEGGRQVRIDRFSWLNGQGLGRLTNASASISGNFSGKRGGGVSAGAPERGDFSRDNLTEEQESELEFIRANPHEYVDFTIPWNLSFGYDVRYNRTILDQREIVQTVRFNGDLSLTEQWKVRFNSGYDFKSKEFTMTTLNIDRDLHCWQMSFTWVPFGRFTSYNIMIRAKSSLLQDLKLTKRRSHYDRY
jgi:lipopolysaccharide assembly outer membrane protein LptD (OstA)